MLDELAIAGNVGRHQRPRHRRRLEQRAGQAFAIGRKDHGRCCRDMRPDIVGMAEMLDDALLDPLIRSSAAPMPLRFPSSSRAEQLKPPVGLSGFEQPGGLNEVAHALVAEQPANEQEAGRISRRADGAGCKSIQVDAGTRQQIVPARA